MNSVLDSPIEALAFDYVRFGMINVVVNSLWTWLAVVTAAVSFWRLRPRRSLKLKEKPSSNDVVLISSNGSAPFTQTSPPAVTAAVVGPTCTSHAAVASSLMSCRFEEEGGHLTKGVKFALYYDEDDNGHVDGGDELSEAEAEAEESGGEEWWEGGLRMRKEERSWYRCQDMRVFNGNVVRLWNSKRGFS